MPATIAASVTAATFMHRLKSYFLSQLATLNDTIRLCPQGNCPHPRFKFSWTLCRK